MIYSQRSDGLGTRVLSAIYAQIFSEQVGVPMGLIWTPLGWPFGVRDTPLMHPNNIFELFGDLAFFRDGQGNGHGRIVLHEEPVSTELLSLYEHRYELFALSQAELAQVSSMGKGVNYDFPGPLFRFMTEDADAPAKVARIAGTINWNAHILGTVAAIDETFRLENCLSVHVRRGDIVEMLFRSDLADLIDGGMTQILQRYTPLQAYFDAVDRHRRGGIVVCTEDDGVVERFQHRYGAHRIASCSARDLSENQRAAVDLILLSKSRRIVAPVLSFFSQCAAAIGNTRIRNTAWHLKDTTTEITALVRRAESARSEQVLAVMYAAAYRISEQNDLNLASYYRGLGTTSDAALFEQAMA
ncbi:hypothetical protein [Methylobacterium sp. J-068]|uniref:hypothetical protein n=1 Tax=Methylobacterium sp. J-068 TaxID=2836649 RepID=UPI001FBB1214|nr:hypothetical protein [Methylobacterium sp. J-068]MCJ2037092.1 hypothetical protein [Methylobacterium sp. J-068]